METRRKAEAKLRFAKPTQEGALLVYVSKCGRFRIERRQYVAPVSCVGYTASMFGKKEKYDADSLSDAKDWCSELASTEAP